MSDIVKEVSKTDEDNERGMVEDDPPPSYEDLMSSDSMYKVLL